MTDTNTKTKFDWKTAFTSKGVWGSVIVVVATIAGIFGFDAGAVNTELTALLGAGLAFWGRITATRALFKKVEPTEPQA